MSSCACGGTRECFPCDLVSLGGVLYGCRRENKPCLTHPQGFATCRDGAGGSRGSTRAGLRFCAEPSSHVLQRTAVIGETWGRAALGRDGCMQTLSEMVLGKTGVLPEIQKTCSGTGNFLFLPISFSFPLSPFPSPLPS